MAASVNSYFFYSTANRSCLWNVWTRPLIVSNKTGQRLGVEITGELA